MPKVRTRGRRPKMRIVVAAAAANSWERQAQKRKQLADYDVGPLLRDMEAGQRPEWRDISDRVPTYKHYWTK
jgi:hypothetical protein